jgi:hypothetical protein
METVARVQDLFVALFENYSTKRSLYNDHFGYRLTYISVSTELKRFRKCGENQIIPRYAVLKIKFSYTVQELYLSIVFKQGKIVYIYIYILTFLPIILSIIFLLLFYILFLF